MDVHVLAVAEARFALQEWDPDLLFVEVDLERGRAADLIGVRVKERRVPTIAVTRHTNPAAKLNAFDLGADDVLNVPFLPEELVARAMAVIRRAYEERIDVLSGVAVGDLEVDLLTRTVRIGGSRRVIELSPLEHGLLWLLAANAGGIVSRRAIEESLWGGVLETASNIVDQYVHRLRKRLGDDPRRPRFIQTVGRTGCRFVAGSVNEIATGED